MGPVPREREREGRRVKTKKWGAKGPAVLV